MTKREIYKLCRSIKSKIWDDDRAFNEDERPGIQLTVACGDDMKEWSFQTGDNSYSGGAYFHPHWAVVGVYRDSNCREVTNDIFEQIEELIYQ